MSDDINDHVAAAFHGLVADLQRNDVVAFDDDLKRQAAARAELRARAAAGMTAGELLRQLDGDPEENARKVVAALDKIDREAKAAAAATQDQRGAMTDGHFPPPPVTG